MQKIKLPPHRLLADDFKGYKPLIVGSFF